MVLFDDIDGHLFAVHTKDNQVNKRFLSDHLVANRLSVFFKLELVLQFLEYLGVALPVRYPSDHMHSLDAFTRLTSAGRAFDAFHACATANNLQLNPDLALVASAMQCPPFAVRVGHDTNVWGQVPADFASTTPAQRWARLFSLGDGWAAPVIVAAEDKRAFIELVANEQVKQLWLIFSSVSQASV
jgi:hypothetical protein